MQRRTAAEGRRAVRLLVVSPVRNEADHFERVARAVLAQTRPPDAWVVVDDGSEDDTAEMIRALASDVALLLPVRSDDAPDGQGDRLARGAAVRAFNRGLRAVDWDDYTHVGKLDGDVELPPDYFERLLARFAADPSLGIAGGRLVERFGERWRLVRIPDYHVHGALKLYSTHCLEAIGGLEERLGWDTIDETYARMKGYATSSFDDLVCRHHRHWGTAEGRLRGRARHGEAAYVVRYGLAWVLLRSFKVALARPVGLSGVAFLYGYLRAAARSVPKVDDDDFRRFVRRELRRRLAIPLPP
jgi:biofilm PGA synthesis N-glycosyltransferase PgaC